MRKPSVALLAAISAASPFAMAICVPALPAIAVDFGTSQAGVQFVISAYLIGLGIAQPLQGPLCDRFGRRRLLILSLILFVAASLLCAPAPTLGALIAARLLQAVGVSVGTVAARAIVRDLYELDEAAAVLSFITAAMALSPILAPPAGGLLAQLWGWPATFLAAGAYGTLLLVWVIVSLPETRPSDALGSFSPLPILRHWADLLRSRRFLGYSLLFGFLTGAFFSFLSVAPTYFAERLGVSAGAFGLYWGLLALSFMIGASLGGRLTRRHGMERQLRLGNSLFLATGLSLPLAVFLLPPSVATIIVPMAAVTFSSGMTQPLSLAGAVDTRPAIAGTASGLASSIGMGVGAAFTALSGWLYDGSARPMALCVAAAAALGAGAGALALSRRSRGPAPPPTARGSAEPTPGAQEPRNPGAEGEEQQSG